ncbi:hypothetical protein CERSUDRAFT_126049, partial [Gelatoporia subvermispora B]
MSGKTAGPETGYGAHTQSSHDAIKDELAGKIERDDASVFAHLGVDNVDRGFVTEAMTRFEQNGTLQSNRLFEFIESLQDQFGNTARIRFSQSSDVRLIIEKSDSWDYPSNKPDYSAVSEQSFQRPGDRWRDRHSWCEIKVRVSDGPYSDRNVDAKEIIVQTVDYARLHMSGRPFQLFSVGLLIYGDQFCVGIYDRAGVRFSPSYHIWDDLDTFIRVVRCITTNMTPEQLGQDPTVTTVTGIEHDQWFAKLQANGISIEEYIPGEPVYEVSLGGTDSRRWVTVGTPIWISLSLFDRGTLVWLVRNKTSLDLRVLKNAWHSGARTPESEIYQLIEGEHPGVARFDNGADVKFPGTGDIISTASLRGRGDANSAEHSVLHRVFIYPEGRSLFKARSELELLKGMRAALRGHEFLCSQYILHRDISVGNIMLSVEDDPPEGAEGFLMDLELALCTGPRVEYKTLAPVRTPIGQVLSDVQVKPSRWDTQLTKRGAPMTGTLQFMAVDLLMSLDDQLKAARREASEGLVEQAAHHDIESFIWVLLYSLFRRALLEADHRTMTAQEKTWMRGLQTEFKQYFGQNSPHSILGQRSDIRGPWYVAHHFPSFFSDPIRKLVRNLASQFT